MSDFLISEAKQSRPAVLSQSRLRRRFAPRNDRKVLDQPYREPGDDRQHDGCGEHGVAAEMSRSDVEPVPGIPGEMTDAIAQMVEERDRPQEQQQYPDRRRNKGVRRCEHLAARRHGDEPPGEPTVRAMPVNRCRTDKADVIWKRYHVGNMNSDSGRSMAIRPPLFSNAPPSV
jgi:hypothetical protein